MKILYNLKFHRWEVYSDHPVIRNGEPQPKYVSAKYEKCEKYVRAVT